MPGKEHLDIFSQTAIASTRLLDNTRHEVMYRQGGAHGLFKLPLQAVGFAQAPQIEINERFLITGVVAELAVVIVTGFDKLQGRLHQAPLCLAFAFTLPDRMAMALVNRPYLI